MSARPANFHGLHVRKWYAFREETLALESGPLADGQPLIKVVLAAAVDNPHAGSFVRSFDEVIEMSRELGAEFGRRLRASLGASAAQSYGKAALVGTAAMTLIVPLYWTTPNAVGGLAMLAIGAFAGIGHWLLIVALRLATRRPDLFLSLTCHEPPLWGLLENDAESRPLLAQAARSVESIGRQIAAGDHAGAARQFVEEVTAGPGVWDGLVPTEVKEVMIRNAPTFLDELRDPTQVTIDEDSLTRIEIPVRLTLGTESPPLFPRVIDRLERALVHAAAEHGAHRVDARRPPRAVDVPLPHPGAPRAGHDGPFRRGTVTHHLPRHRQTRNDHAREALRHDRHRRGTGRARSRLLPGPAGP